MNAPQHKFETLLFATENTELIEAWKELKKEIEQSWKQVNEKLKETITQLNTEE